MDKEFIPIFAALCRYMSPPRIFKTFVNHYGNTKDASFFIYISFDLEDGYCYTDISVQYIDWFKDIKILDKAPVNEYFKYADHDMYTYAVKYLERQDDRTHVKSI